VASLVADVYVAEVVVFVRVGVAICGVLELAEDLLAAAVKC
jgi:hypothetical protein